MMEIWLLTISSLIPTGLHGASIVITGRRQNVIDHSVEAMKSDGIQVIGVQVSQNHAHHAAFFERRTSARPFGHLIGNGGILRQVQAAPIIKQSIFESKLLRKCREMSERQKMYSSG